MFLATDDYWLVQLSAQDAKTLLERVEVEPLAQDGSRILDLLCVLQAVASGAADAPPVLVVRFVPEEVTWAR